METTEAALRDGLSACLRVPRWVDQVVARGPYDDGQPQRFSRSEQQSSDSDDPERDAALTAGNRAYEERFGRVFLIRAAGRTRPEILAELRRRLRLDPDTEREIVSGELRDIALLSIRQLFADPGRT